MTGFESRSRSNSRSRMRIRVAVGDGGDVFDGLVDGGDVGVIGPLGPNTFLFALRHVEYEKMMRGCGGGRIDVEEDRIDKV